MYLYDILIFCALCMLFQHFKKLLFSDCTVLKNSREMKEIQILRQLAFVQLYKDLKICHQVQIYL